MNGEQLADLLGALRGIPNLPDAACRNLPELFDATDEIDAEPAIALCRSCPALQDCAAWAATLPKNSISGVVAARIHVWTDRRRKAGAA
ncbi:WhiB family transcriptional regulator [Mycobacterium sp. UM_CSW]|uniref:WhiB family transcriptional regulator n=1 Tax=Mycobacterium sp. UM_CSW TaxID=1370119 RepID=UPI00042307F2|nr:WhiB family transcriptional regulator [Mycobacterium sp. UM_CSW]